MIQILYGNTEKAFYFLDAVDDRYFSHYLLHSFLRALEKRQNNKVYPVNRLPFQYDQVQFFRQAGLLSYTKSGKYVIIGGYKGGVCRVFDGEVPCFEDYGYRVRLGKGKIAATNWQNPNYAVNFEKDTFVVSGRFNLVKQKVSTPIMHLGLRIASVAVGSRIIGLLKKMLIFVDKQTDICFERQIKICGEKIQILDKIQSPQPIDLECADGFSLRHVASGRFFAAADIGNHSRQIYRNIKEISLERTFVFGKNTIEETVRK